MKRDNATSKQTFLKLMQLIGKYKILLVFSIILAGVTVVLMQFTPILFGDAIDGIIAAGNVNFDLVCDYLFKILIMVLATALMTWGMNMINNRLAYKVVQDVRSRAIRQIQVLPLSVLDSSETGDIVGRVIADVDQLSDGLLLGFTQLFTGVVTIAVTLIFMFSRSWLISLLVILLTPLSFFVANFISQKSFHMFQKQMSTRGAQTALIEEMVGHEKVVKAFAYEQRASERFDAVNKELQKYSQKAIFFSSLTNPSTRFVNSIIYAVVAMVGSFLILDGHLTVGGLSIMLAYANQYMKPFNDISSVVTELQNALVCAARVFSLIEEEPEVAEQPAVLPDSDGAVSIEDVSFSYVPEKKLIENFSLDVKPGMSVAIVGPTGCGKTTFINLLMRFYDVTGGVIKIDGVPIKDVTRHSLRANFGMVLQETWLKHGTIRENIAYGCPNATEEQIISAAKEAHSWEFIRRMPKGLDTVVNDDSLSAGQKQLLCITRVMLAIPPMLILDEATSNIDTRTEVLIQSAFDKLMNGRTSFIVAHRLSTIRNADLILVMKDGHIIEQGNHNELMKQGGFYNNLYNSQFVHA